MVYRCVTALVIIASLTTGAVAKVKPVSMRDREQAACYDDAQRLCGNFMPSVDKVTACMKPLKAKVSAKCAAFYK